MSSDFFAPPGRGKQAAIIAGAVLVAVALVFAGIGISSLLSDDEAPTGQTASESPSDPTTLAENNSLTILTGQRLENGVGVGYPHTTVGAVSAAVEYMSRLGSTLDPDRAERIADIVLHPDSERTAKDAAQGVRDSRERLGLPQDGELPETVSVLVAPVSYQLRDETNDQMTILLLGYWTFTPDTGEAQEEVGVFPVTVRWSNDDWKLLVPDKESDYSDLAAIPYSTEAKTKGWLDLSR